MIDASSFFRGDEKPLSIFAKGEPPPLAEVDRGWAYVGGVFFAGSESRESDPEVYEYNRAITSFIGNWEALFKKMLEDGLGKKETRENRELRTKWRSEIENLLKFFIEFLKGKDVKPWSVKFAPLSLRRKKKDVPIGEDVSSFNVNYGRLTKGKGDVSLYYLDLDVSDRLEDIRGRFVSGELTLTDYLEELGRLRREVEVELIERILECENLEDEVREFFKALRELGKRKDDILAQLFFERLFKIEINFHVGLTQDGEGEESAWMSHKPLINRLGYGDTKLSYEDVLLRIGKKAVEKSELSDKPDDELKKEVEEEGESLGVVKWLKKVYREKGGGTPFLKKLRRELRKILEDEVPGVKKVSFAKDGRAVYRVKKKIYADTYGQFLLYEDGLRDKAISLLRALWGKDRRRERFVNPEVMEKEVRGIEIEFLFPFWEELKKSSSFTGEKAYKALAFLLQVAGFFKAIRSWGVERGTTYMVFALLDVMSEEDFYPIWNVVRAFVDHVLAHPYQTLTRKSIDKIAGNDKDAIYFHKNALISALRSERKVVLDFTGLEVRKPILYSLLVEDRTIETAGKGRHYLYSLYRFFFENNTLIIERDDRKFFVFADGFSGDVKELDKFLLETPNLIAIVQDLNSPLLDYGKKEHDSFFPVLYRSIKTPVPLTEGRKRDKDAYIIFEKEFKKGLRYVGWLGNGQEGFFKDYTLFVVRAPFVIPGKFYDEPYISTELSLFFVGNLKGDNPEVEESVLLTLLGWLVWGSESFAFLYAKPKFIPLKLPKVVVRRKNRDYTVPLGTSVFELAYLIKKAEEKVQD